MTTYRFRNGEFVGPDGRPMLDQAARLAPIAMPAVIGDLPPYRSPVTGEVIDGRSARREDLKRHDCREVDPSEVKNRGYLSNKFEAKVKDGVRKMRHG